MLNLPEMIYILAMHEEKGTVLEGISRRLRYALSGALIAELALQGQIAIEHSQKIKPASLEPTGDKLLDKAMEQIRATDRGRKVSYWVDTFATEKPKRLQKRLVADLVIKKVVHENDARLVWEVPYIEAPQQNASAKYWIKSRLRALVLTCGTPDLHDLALLSMVSASLAAAAGFHPR